MKDYTLSQQLALIGLDSQDSTHRSVAKSAVLRSLKVAELLESLLAEPEMPPTASLISTLQAETTKTKLSRGKSLRTVEKEIAGPLLAAGDLEEIPDLLACDMEYVTAGVGMMTYRTQAEVYRRVTEGLRAEILEEGPITADCFFLLWLLRECGCIHDLFSVAEQEIANRRLISLAADSLYKGVLEISFANRLERIAGKALDLKGKLFKNPHLQGINLIFPFLERRQSIFIDNVILGTTVANHRMAVLTYLSERGHYVEEVLYGEETLLKIDNALYRVFPTVRVYKLPIQGIALLPVYW